MPKRFILAVCLPGRLRLGGHACAARQPIITYSSAWVMRWHCLAELFFYYYEVFS